MLCFHEDNLVTLTPFMVSDGSPHVVPSRLYLLQHLRTLCEMSMFCEYPMKVLSTPLPIGGVHSGFEAVRSVVPFISCVDRWGWVVKKRRVKLPTSAFACTEGHRQKLDQGCHLIKFSYETSKYVSPPAGFEPTTYRLTACRSTN